MIKQNTIDCTWEYMNRFGLIRFKKQNVDYQNVTLCWVRLGKGSFWGERCSYGAERCGLLMLYNELFLSLFWVRLG